MLVVAALWWPLKTASKAWWRQIKASVDEETSAGLGISVANLDQSNQIHKNCILISELVCPYYGSEIVILQNNNKISKVGKTDLYTTNEKEVNGPNPEQHLDLLDHCVQACNSNFFIHYLFFGTFIDFLYVSLLLLSTRVQSLAIISK